MTKSFDSTPTCDLNGTKRSFFSDQRRRVWVHGPRPEYELSLSKSLCFDLPARVIPLIRSSMDIVVLPGNHEPTREYWKFCRDTLRLQDWQAIFTSGSKYSMDDGMDDQVIDELKGRMASSNGGWTLVPYSVTPNFERWASKLRPLADVEVFGEDVNWTERYGHKGVLHRHVRSLDQPSVLEQIDRTIKVPAGYTCSNVEDLLTAFHLLGDGSAVIKPIYGAGGGGIVFVSSAAELKAYEFPEGDVCLEERLTLDLAPDGMVVTPALHYMEGEQLGEPADQMMQGTSYVGWRTSAVDARFAERARAVLQLMIEHAQPCGAGGVDFLSVGGEPILCDLNMGRFNGCHAPKLFLRMYAPHSSFLVWKGSTPAHLTVEEFWAKCRAAGFAYQPGESKEGVFPLLYLRGSSFWLMALADDDEICERLRHAADAILTSAQLEASDSG